MTQIGTTGGFDAPTKVSISEPGSRSSRVSKSNREVHERVHGAGKRRKMTKKATPPYRWMVSELEKKILKLDVELAEQTAKEQKIQRREMMQEVSAQRAISQMTKELEDVDTEIAAIDDKIKRSKEMYEKKDSYYLDMFNKLCEENRQAKELIQLNIDSIKTRHHDVWRENFNLKRYKETGSWWSRKTSSKLVVDDYDDRDHEFLEIGLDNDKDIDEQDGGGLFGANGDDDDFLADTQVGGEAGEGGDDDFLVDDEGDDEGQKAAEFDANDADFLDDEL